MHEFISIEGRTAKTGAGRRGVGAGRQGWGKNSLGIKLTLVGEGGWETVPLCLPPQYSRELISQGYSQLFGGVCN